MDGLVGGIVFGLSPWVLLALPAGGFTIYYVRAKQRRKKEKELRAFYRQRERMGLGNGRRK